MGLPTNNAKPHTANIVNNFLNQNAPARLCWPSRSPDLNPIENLWVKVKQLVYCRYPQNIRELEIYFVKEMEKISKNFVKIWLAQ